MNRPQDVKPRYFSGSEWKTHKILKKGKGHQTPGSAKNENCKADAGKKYFAKCSRSYKSRKGFGSFQSYSDWCRKMDSLNGGKR